MTKKLTEQGKQKIINFIFRHTEENDKVILDDIKRMILMAEQFGTTTFNIEDDILTIIDEDFE